VTRSNGGTYLFHTFATMSIVGKDERLTLRSLPIIRLDTKEGVVSKLFENFPKPSLLMDKGLFSVEIINKDTF